MGPHRTSRLIHVNPDKVIEFCELPLQVENAQILEPGFLFWVLLIGKYLITDVFHSEDVEDVIFGDKLPQELLQGLRTLLTIFYHVEEDPKHIRLVGEVLDVIILGVLGGAQVEDILGP